MTDTIDTSKVEAFAGQFLTDLAGASTTAMIVIGDRLGIYRALTGSGPLSAEQLAKNTGLHPRLVTEWLANQTVSGYVTYDPAQQTYQLPTEHALVLAADSPALIVGAAETVAGQFLMLEHLERAMRTDGAIDYAAQPHTLHDGLARFFRTAYVHQLADNWFPAIDGLVDRLAAGAKVADVGCGHGISTLLMAQRWPASTFHGYDFHEPSIVTARANAVEQGSPDNVTFRTATSTELDGGPYDVVVYFDALHDMGDPLAALRTAYGQLAPGGIIIAVEPWSLDRLEDGIGHPAVRVNYGVSTSLCTPGSLAQPGAYGLGTQGGPAKRLALLAEAGFADSTVAVDDGMNLVLTGRRG